MYAEKRLLMDKGAHKALLAAKAIHDIAAKRNPGKSNVREFLQNRNKKRPGAGEIGRPSANVQFKNGGRVRKTGKATVHKGEYVLPRGVAPTARQKRMVAKRGGKK
jgi:hypothetical protein